MELFGTAGIRGGANETVTPSLALAVGTAVGRDLKESDSGTPAVVIARDGRETGEALASAIEAGVLSAGARALRSGHLPTPALAYASRDRYGVMLTASHNPPEDNGIKLFCDGEEFDAAAEARIEDRIGEETRLAQWDEWGDVERIDPLDEYRRSVVAYAERFGSSDLDGQTFVVDCGNGMASLGTPQVLRKLGAHVITLNANVDGHFSGRGSKPTPETLSDLCAFVSDYPDPVVGIGHDGDADRIVLVDTTGEIVHEDTVLAILSEHYVRNSNSEDPVVVTTPNASGRIDERVRAADGRTERVRLGYLQDGVTDARNEGGTVVFAAEPWKHIHPAFGPWIDGIQSAAVLAVLINEAEEDGSEEDGLSVLRDPITERPYRKENAFCPDDRKGLVMERMQSDLPEQFPAASAETEYGLRLDFDDGSWVLVRPSGTEPYVRVYAESDTVDELISRVITILERAVEASE